MNDIKHLEFLRMMNELKFIESDYKYQSEIIKISDNEFLKSVYNVLDKFPELNEIYQKNQDIGLEIILNKLKNDNIVVEDLPKDKSKISKKLYREIVKSTHPDKIKDDKLNELYLEASEAYEKNDEISIYKVCYELGIRFDYDDEFLNQIKNKIKSYKKKIEFLENTYTFKWIKTDNELNKNKIVIEFIRSKIFSKQY